MNYVKDISLFLVISFVINITSKLLGTNFLLNYLKSDLTTIQLGLLAINTTTCGLIVSKLQEFRNQYPQINIKPITKEMLVSLKEQVILIVIGILLMIIMASDFLNKLVYCEYIKFTLETLLIAVFINAIQILWDTGKAVFIIVDIMDDINSKD